jgi:cation diffusion facilitator family transporter
MKNSSFTNIETPNRTDKAAKVTWVGFGWNVILTILKFIVGVIANSAALIADSIHSLSDFAGDLAVLAGIKLAKRPSDEDHHYGHGKYETLAAIILSLILMITAAGFLWQGGYLMIKILNSEIVKPPTWPALAAAFLSIIVKEALFRYTYKAGNELHSSPLVANAWHHRSDALSSIAAFTGIAGAIFLGDKWLVLDPIAAVVVSIFIAKTAYSIGKSSLDELLEASLDENENKKIVELVNSVPGANHPHNLKTRKIGYYLAMEMHIYVDPSLNIIAAHNIATQVETLIKEQYGSHTIVSIHIEPSI